MVAPNFSKILFVLILSILAVGINHAFAVDVTDTVGWQNTKNYGMVSAAADCSQNGNNIMNDGICDNWKVNSGPNPGLQINWSDPVTATTYVYNLSCNPHATYVPNTNDPQNVVDPTGLEVCPSPQTADVYVELDWMTKQGPVDPSVISDVVSAYFKHGIQLHVQAGENPVIQNGIQQITPDSGNMTKHYCNVNWQRSGTNSPLTNNGLACNANSAAFQGYGFMKQNFFGTVSERTPPPNDTTCPSNALPSTAGTVANAFSYNCLTAKRQVFHYAEFVNRQKPAGESSGWSEVPGNDFFISLGTFTNGVGSIDEQEAAFMHELGHNFNLHHGGVVVAPADEDANNCKPNYLSVMSYTYEFRKTADICRPLDYSNATLSTLDENNLNENTPLSIYNYPSDNPPPPAGTAPNQPDCVSTQSAHRPIWFSSPTGTVVVGHTGQKNDWNHNGVNDGVIPAQNINNMGISGCTTSTETALAGFNDWDSILHGTYGSNFTPDMNFRASSNFGTGNIAGGVVTEIGNTQFVQEASDPNAQLPPPPDDISPILSSTSDIVVSTTVLNGTVVNYPMPTATDNVGVTSGPTCTPSSGSNFQVGTTVVTCTASDATGNTGSSTFNVTVKLITFPWHIYVMAAIIIGVVIIIGVWSIFKSHKINPSRF